MLALKALAADLLPLRLACTGRLSPDCWDSAPFVAHLADASLGCGSFAPVKHVCTSVHTFKQQRSSGSTQSKQSIQAFAHKELRSHNGGFSFYSLMHRRCVPLGISHLGVISPHDVKDSLVCASRANNSAAIAWLKTVTNAWCTSYRMHETRKLCCIFGCRTCPDRIDHYILCPILQSLLDEAFGGSLTPCIFSGLNFASPSERNLYIIAAAFDIYMFSRLDFETLLMLPIPRFYLQQSVRKRRFLLVTMDRVITMFQCTIVFTLPHLLIRIVQYPPTPHCPGSTCAACPATWQQLPALIFQSPFIHGPDLSINDHR